MFFIYTRVSTVEQAEDNRTSLAEQERVCLGVAVSRGIDRSDIVVYSDPGISGSEPLKERKEGKRLVADMKPGDFVCAAKLDRMFRSAIDALRTIEEFQNGGIGLILPEFGFEPVTNNGAGKLFFGILSLVADFERDTINDRMRLGKSAKASRGGHIGGEAQYGHRIIGRGREAIIEIDEREQEIVQLVTRLRQRGDSISRIQKRLVKDGVRRAPARISIGCKSNGLSSMPAMPADLSIPSFLDRRPFVASYSALDQFKKCPHKFYRQYIVKDQPYIETPERKYGNDVHAAFAQRLSSKQPLPESMRKWERFAYPFDGYQVLVEQKLGMTERAASTGFWDNDVWFRGTPDAAVIKDDKAFILDWKSGNSKYEDPFELETNALLLKMKFPQLQKVVGSYAWLKEDRVGNQYDLSDFKKTYLAVMSLVVAIKAKIVSSEWPKQKSSLCGWCSVEDCEYYYVAKK